MNISLLCYSIQGFRFTNSLVSPKGITIIVILFTYLTIVSMELINAILSHKILLFFNSGAKLRKINQSAKYSKQNLTEINIFLVINGFLLRHKEMYSIRTLIPSVTVKSIRIHIFAHLVNASASIHISNYINTFTSINTLNLQHFCF